MEPGHSETGDCRVEPPASILVARLSMSHLVPLLEFNLGRGSEDFIIRIRNGKLVTADTGDQGGIHSTISYESSSSSLSSLFEPSPCIFRSASVMSSTSSETSILT